MYLRWRQTAEQVSKSYMKGIVLISHILVSSVLFGQPSISFTTDSLVKTSEIYVCTYDIDRNDLGTWSIYWYLDYDFTLYYGSSVDSPPSNRKFDVGSWHINNDSIELTIKRPKRLGKSEPFKRKYGVFEIIWSTNTGFKEKSSNEPLILTSRGIVLTEDRNFKIKDTLAKLNEYILEQFKPSHSELDDETFDGFEEHVRINRLARNYFNKEKILFGIKEYVNGNLRRN